MSFAPLQGDSTSLCVPRALASTRPLAFMDIPDSLLKDISRGNCVVFVGAGLSVGAGLPNWPSLLKRMLEWGLNNGMSLSDDEKAEISQHLQNQEFLLVAEELTDRLNKEPYQRFMREIGRASCR